MSKMPKHEMTVDEFLVWAETQPGRHELVGGHVYAMAPERVGHTRTKYAVCASLSAAVKKAGSQCEMLMDGATVRIDRRTVFEPDALVRCGKPLPSDVIETPDAVIVVEVLSPSTGDYDRAGKLIGYFTLPSVHHYMIVDPDRRVVIHHRRDGDAIATRIVGSGALRLDPPGIDLMVEDLFEPA